MAGKKPGAGPSARVSRSEILKAARRFYLGGETQTQIAKDMGISPSYLARRLKKAVEDGWVRIYVDTDRQTELAAQIMEKYPHLVHVEVVPSGPTYQHTAWALGTAMARWLDDILDKDESTGDPLISNVAIGGGLVHQSMVEQLVRRKNRLSVGPTALTPQMGRVERFNAISLATTLALKWGALQSGSRDPEERAGYLYSGTVEPPGDSLEELRAWYQRLQMRPGYLDILRFWNQLDIVFIGAVDLDWRYKDVHDRLKRLGLSMQEMEDRGAVAMLGNRFVDAEGNEVSLAEGLPSYEPVMPTEAIQSAEKRYEESKGKRGFVVLDLWGEPGEKVVRLLQHMVVNVVFIDLLTAEKLVHK